MHLRCLWGDPENVVLLQNGILSCGASLLKPMALNRTYKVNGSPPCKLLQRQGRFEWNAQGYSTESWRSAEAPDDVTAWNPFSEKKFITFVSCSNSIFSKRSFNASNGLLWAPGILQAPRLLDMENVSKLLILMLWFVCRKWLEMILEKVWNRACEDGRATLSTWTSVGRETLNSSMNSCHILPYCSNWQQEY